MRGLAHHRAEGVPFLPPVSTFFVDDPFGGLPVEEEEARAPAVRHRQLMEEGLRSRLSQAWVAVDTEDPHVLLADLRRESADQVLVGDDGIEVHRNRWDVHRLVNPCHAEVQVGEEFLVSHAREPQHAAEQILDLLLGAREGLKRQVPARPPPVLLPALVEDRRQPALDIGRRQVGQRQRIDALEVAVAAVLPAALLVDER